MKTSEAGIQFIASFEGYRAKAYQDTGGVWTVGYGHTGSDVHEGLVITHDRALALLAKDVVIAEKAVNKLIATLRWKFTQNVFDALVSFVFNCGVGTLERGRSLGNALRRGLRSVPAAMLLYVRDAKGQVLLGLKRRREAEGALLLKPAEHSTPADWLTRDELKHVRELDRLRSVTRPTAATTRGIADERAWLTAQRKRIWHAAQDSRGWDYRERRRRYNSLLARTA